jgi:hypothetical protein
LRSLDRGRSARHTLFVDPEEPSEPAQQENKGVLLFSTVARRTEMLNVPVTVRLLLLPNEGASLNKATD